MAKVKIESNQQAKTKINEWKAGQNQADELVYSPTDLDGNDVQLWAFKQSVLIDVQQEVGPFKKLLFVAVV